MPFYFYLIVFYLFIYLFIYFFGGVGVAHRVAHGLDHGLAHGPGPRFCLHPVITQTSGLEITASQRTMSGMIGELTGQPFVLPVMLTGHI